MSTLPTPPISDTWLQAAGIASPWRVTQVKTDPVAKMLHLWITRHPLPEVAAKKRHWFGMLLNTAPPNRPPSSTTPQGPEMQWRHLNSMDYACLIHTTDVLEEPHHNLPWLGQKGMPFTNRMGKHITACVSKGVELATVAQLFDVSYADLWKFKFAIDQGSTPMPAASGNTSAAALRLPEPSHPMWEQLVAGDIQIDIKTLGFQLLLSKLRQQINLHPTPEVKTVKLRELHRYMVRNAHSLSNELQQLQSHLNGEAA
jgi:hypothetical protein